MKKPDFFKWTSAALFMAALLTACGQSEPVSDAAESAPQDKGVPSETDTPEPVVTEETQVPSPSTTPKPEQAPAARPTKYYNVAWAGDAAVCVAVAQAIDSPSPVANKNVNYAEAQAAFALGGDHAISWTAQDDGAETASLDYFNDGVVRVVERREGMVSGNRIINLWTEDGAGKFMMLNVGHAGANTQDAPEIDNLNTKLTYSVSDIVVLDGGYRTLVAPLRDIDKSGDVYVVNWRLKNGVEAPFGPRDYYPYLDCLLARAKEGGEQ